MKTFLSPPKQHLSKSSSSTSNSTTTNKSIQLTRTRSITQPTYSHSNSNSIKSQTPSPQSSKSQQSPTGQSFSIGDRVQCSNSMVGICRFLGTIHSKPGIWVGIDLSNQKNQPPNPWHGKGKNSGAVDGVVYFECLPLCGIFFPLSKVISIPSETSATNSLKIPQPLVNQQSNEPSAASISPISSPSQTIATTASSSPSIHSQSDLFANRSKTSSVSSNPSTPRPRNRPTLPTPLDHPSPTRKPSLPVISNSSSSVVPAKKQLIRKPSSVKLSYSSRAPPTVANPLPPPQLPSEPSHQQTFNPPDLSSNLPSNKFLKNSLSKSTNQIKRSSVYQVPSRPASRTSHKRAESANSHYGRTDLPDWAKESHAQRPKSRLSLVSTSEPRHPQPSNSHLVELSQLPLLQTENAELKEKIVVLQREVQHGQLQAVELEQKYQQKCGTLELELERSKESLSQHQKNMLVQLEKTKQELAQKSEPELNSLREEISKLKENLQTNQQTLNEQTSKFGQERTELQNQLHQLRSAGQSLCGVYESKISNLEEIRLSQLHETEFIRGELKAAKLALEELEQKAQSNAAESAINATACTNATREAVEIDNERLKDDLNHTKERLSEVQDEAYQLKQELENEREVREEQSRLDEQTLEQHLLSMKEVKDEKSKLENEKASLEFKLGQVEARLKETLETMERERVELEGLRAEILVSSHHHQASKSPRSAEENNETATIVNTATGGSVSSERMMSDGSNFRQTQLESELKEKQSRVEFLESELARYLSSGKPQSSIEPESNMDGTAIMDQEKMLVIQKYQRLLLIKDEENLKLMNRLEELEEELESNSKSRFSLSPSRGLLFHQFQPSPQLKHHASTQSLRTTKSFYGSPHIASTFSPNPNRNPDEIDTAKELAKVTQQLVGLKLIARQSNEERAKCEKDNQALKDVIEDLKQNNRTLEQKVVELVEAGGTMVHKIKTDTSEQNMAVIGIEMENALAEVGNTLNDSNENHPNSQGVKVIIGDYKRVKELEHEIDQLKEKLVNLEQKHSRQVGALQNEVIELEGIIEAKVFQEEKLELDIEELKQALESTKQSQMNASTPKVGGGLRHSNSKHFHIQSVSPDHPSQAPLPSHTIPTSNQWSNSKRASSFEYKRHVGPIPKGFEGPGYVSEKSLNSLQEEEEEEEEDEEKGHVLKGWKNRLSKAFRASNSPYIQQHHDGTNPNSDSKTRIIVTDNNDASPRPQRHPKRDRSESNHRHTIANSPSRSPIFPPPLPNYLESHPLPPLSPSERCELCDGVDHQLASCPIFSGKS